MTQKILMGLGVLFLASKAADMALGAAYNKIDWELQRPEWDLSQMALQVLRVTLPIAVTNRNPIAVTVRSIQGRVFYGPTEIGQINTPYGVQLAPGMPQVLRLRLDVRVPSLVQDLVQAIQSNAYNALVNRLRFEGTIYTDIVAVPISMNIPIVGA